jgi:hypothetical protein
VIDEKRGPRVLLVHDAMTVSKNGSIRRAVLGWVTGPGPALLSADGGAGPRGDLEVGKDRHLRHPLILSGPWRR